MKQEYIILRTPSQDLREPAFPGLELLELNLDEAEDVRGQPDVIAVSANMPVVLNLPVGDEVVPRSEECGDSWGIEKMGGGNTPLDGSGMIGAILDTGLDRRHPAFRGMKLVEKDFTGEGSGDRHGHGTHCAGVLCGKDIEGARIGLACGIEKLLVGKVLDAEGEGEVWNMVEGLHWAAVNGANVITMSLQLEFTKYLGQLIEMGYPPEIATSFALDAHHATIDLLQRLIAHLRVHSEALVVIAGAGDSNRCSENFAWERAVSSPAGIQGVISTGALARRHGDLAISNFSHRGASGVAPGVEIASAASGSSGLVSMSGTGIAASHVGGAALLWGQWLLSCEGLTSFTLEARLLGSGSVEYLDSDMRPADVGCGMFLLPSSEEVGAESVGEEKPDREKVHYETKAVSKLELLSFDLNPTTRHLRKQFYRKSLKQIGRSENT